MFYSGYLDNSYMFWQKKIILAKDFPSTVKGRKYKSKYFLQLIPDQIQNVALSWLVFSWFCQLKIKLLYLFLWILAKKTDGESTYPIDHYEHKGKSRHQDASLKKCQIRCYKWKNDKMLQMLQIKKIIRCYRCYR